MLADAGFPNGFTTTWWTSTTGSNMLAPVAISEFIQSNLKAVGVNVKLETFEWAAYLQKVFKGLPDNIGAAAIAYNIGSYTNEPQWWATLFSTKYIPPKGSLNAGYYENPTIDPLADKAIATLDENERASLSKQIEKIVWDDAVYLFAVHQLNVWSTGPKVHGLIPQGDNSPDLSSVWVG
jgi:peptide/nickel transport system substrate-binding protein